MKFEMSVDLSSIDNVVLTKGQKKTILRRVGYVYMMIVRDRLAKGKESSGAAFAPYSKEYMQQKYRAGRLKENYWLRLTGEMLRSQNQTMSMTSGGEPMVTVGFTGTHPPQQFKLPAGVRSKRAGRKLAAARKAKLSPTSKRAPSGRRAPGGKRAPSASRYNPQKLAAKLMEPLVVVEAKGEHTPNALIAAMVNFKRPFVAISYKELDRLHKLVLKMIDSIRKA